MTSPSPCVAAATATALVPDARRLPHAALPHARRHASRRVDSRNLHIRPAREAGVRLEQRPDPRQVVGVAEHDRVRVAHVDGITSRPATRSGAKDLHLAQVLLDLAVEGATRENLARRRRARGSRSAPSHAATIRVALPDISAVEPSGFQMTTSAQSSPRAVTCDDPVSVPHFARTRSRSSATSVDEVDVAVRVPPLHRQSS